MSAKPITARDLIRRQLRKLGCDGLASEECGCGIADLAPCGGDCLGCIPARSEVGPDGLVWRPAPLERRSMAKQGEAGRSREARRDQ